MSRTALRVRSRCITLAAVCAASFGLSLRAIESSFAQQSIVALSCVDVTFFAKLLFI